MRHPPTLFLVCGLPGAGKTTLAKQLEAKHRALRLCPDEWMAALGVDIFDSGFRDRLEQQLTDVAKNLLQQGGCAIVEFGSWAQEERKALRQMAQSVGAKVFLYWLEVSVPELARRVAARGGADAAVLTEAQFWEIERRIERPNPEEAAEFDWFEFLNFTEGM